MADNIFTKSKFRFYPAQKIACGLKHTAALSDSGICFTWGSNAYGQLALSRNFLENEENRPQERESIKQLQGKLTHVSCGSFSTMVIVTAKESDESEEAGKIYAWGQNVENRLGVKIIGEEDMKLIKSPTEVFFKNNDKIMRVYCGPDYSAAISDTGKLYTWGNGSYGNLGHDGTESKQHPELVAISKTKPIIMAALGAKHMLALSNDRTVYSWGNGQNGRLGHGDNKGCIVPKPIEYFTNKEVVFIACGESHSAAITALGELFTWGHGSYYRLGHGDDSDVTEPKQVEGLKKKRIQMIACGIYHNLCNSSNGEVFAWGNPQYGILGILDLNDTNPLTVPRIINRLEHDKITQVAVGKYHSMAITSNGEVYAWGHYGDYKLGIKCLEPQPFPMKIPGVEGVSGRSKDLLEKVVQATGNRKMGNGKIQQKDAWQIKIAKGGSQHTLAVTKGGQLWVWGEGENGALGKGQNYSGDQMTPFLLNNLRKELDRIKNVSCGAMHSMAITYGGDIYMWGFGESGQLGIGSGDAVKFDPTYVESLQGKKIKNGQCGEDFSVVLTDQGEVYSWGNSEVGKLGLGHNVSNQYYPRLIKDLVPIWKISSGMAHVAAISTQRLLYTWGSGFYGRLGHGDTDNRYTPEQVKTSINYKAVACGSYHTLTIEENGYLYIFGRAKHNCSQVDILIPSKIEELKNKAFKQIAAGDGHSLALSLENQIFSWGSNKYGKLGLDIKSEDPQIQPLQVKFLDNKNIRRVGCGYNHSMAISQTGEVFTWGAGGSGRLGQGEGQVQSLRKPKKIEAQWTTMQEKDEGNEDNMTVLDYLMTKISNGEAIEEWQQMMLLLSGESDEQLEKALIEKEKLVQYKINTVENEIRNLRPEFENITKFDSEIQKVLLQRAFQFKIPNDKPFEVKLDKLIAGYIEVHEQIVSTLQLQSCYLSRVINIIYREQPNELSDMMTAINFMYQNINLNSNSNVKRQIQVVQKRDQLLFLNLCKRIIKDEVENTDYFKELFSKETTPSTLFLKTFFRRELGSTIADNLLSTSITAICESDAKKADIFDIDPPNVAQRLNIDIKGKSNEVLLKNRQIKNTILDNSKNIMLFGKKIIDNIQYASDKVPMALKTIFQTAKKAIEKKKWVNDYKKGQGVAHNKSSEFQEKITQKLMALFFKNLLMPILRSPESERLLNDKLLKEISDSNMLKTNLANLANFLNRVIEKDQILSEGGEDFRDINLFSRSSWNVMSDIVRKYCLIQDQSKVELSLTLYESHLILEDPVIQMPSDNYLYLIQKFIILKDRIQFSPSTDQLYKLIDRLEITKNTKTKSENNYKFNLQLPIRVLLKPQNKNSNIIMCPKCKSPIPDFLHPNQDALEYNQNINFGNADSKPSILKRLKSGDDDNNQLSVISEFCRKVDKKFATQSIEDLKENMQQLQQHYLVKVFPPNYELSNFIKFTEKILQELMNNDYNLKQLLAELSSQFRKRQSQRDYLAQIKNELERMIQLMPQFKQEIQNKKKDLQTYLTNTKQFAVLFKFPQSEKSKIKIFQVKETYDKKKEKLQLDKFPPNVQHEIVGKISLKELLAKKIIDKLRAQYSKNIQEKIFIQYLNNSNEGWQFQVIFEKSKRESSSIGNFKLSNEEFSLMKRTANKESRYEIKNLGFVFNSFEFIKFLSGQIQNHFG